MQTLKRIDERAYDYYFQQARSDVMENKVPDIVYERHKRELIGLGVSDMYRYIYMCVYILSFKCVCMCVNLYIYL